MVLGFRRFQPIIVMGQRGRHDGASLIVSRNVKQQLLGGGGETREANKGTRARV